MRVYIHVGVSGHAICKILSGGRYMGAQSCRSTRSITPHTNTWSLSTAAVTRNENSCCRSPTRSAIAQTARHPSVDITDTTPAHTAATLRPDRHHTHGLHTTISGWRLHEPYTLPFFCASTARPGLALEDLRCWPHAQPVGACGQLLRVAWAWPGRAVDAQKANGVVCASRRHQQVKVVESPARARDSWRCRQHG